MKRLDFTKLVLSGLATLNLAGALYQATTTPLFADGSPGCCTTGSDCSDYQDAPWCRNHMSLGLLVCGSGGDEYCCANQTGPCMS